jgi:hypothetical protein
MYQLDKLDQYPSAIGYMEPTWNVTEMRSRRVRDMSGMRMKMPHLLLAEQFALDREPQASLCCEMRVLINGRSRRQFPAKAGEGQLDQTCSTSDRQIAGSLSSVLSRRSY